MTSHIRVLVDVSPPLLADSVARVLEGDGISVETVSSDPPIVHDDHEYDLVVVSDQVRAARPGRLTTRVQADAWESLDHARELVIWLQDHQRSSV